MIAPNSSDKSQRRAGLFALRRRLDSAVDSRNTPRFLVVIGAVLIGLVTWVANEIVEQASEKLIADAADHVLDRLAEELVEYDSLTKVSSHMVASTAIDPLDGIRGYLVGNTLSRYFPATTYIAFVRRIPQRGLEDYRKTVRSQLNTDENGLSSLELRPSADSTEHLFVESTSRLTRTGPSLGTDIAADSVLSAAIRKARAMDRTVLLAPSVGGDVFPLPAILAPIFNPLSKVADDAFLGVLVLGVNMQRLVDAAIPHHERGKWAVGIIGRPASEGSVQDIEFFSTSADHARARAAGHATISRYATFGDYRLSLEVTPLDIQPVGVPLRALPVAAFLAASLVVMLSVLLLRRMQGARFRAEAFARMRHAEAQRSDERFRAMVESSSDWIWELDQNYRFTYASPTTNSFFGAPPDTLIGTSIDEWAGAGLQSALFPFGRATPASYIGHERTMHTGDGKAVVFESSGTLILDDNGGFRGIRGIDRDVTQQRAIREKLAVLNEELSLNMRSNLVNLLLSGLAHELNQPLSAIATYNQACLRLLRQPAPDIHEVTAAMQATASHALVAGDIVKSLRRMTTQHQPVAKRVRVEPLLQNAARLVQHRQSVLQFSLAIRIAEGLPDVLADPILLTQVCLNLLHNAIDALTGAARREITLFAQACGDSRIEIGVRDTGPGLGDADAARIFDAHYTTKREGMGIGLAISRSIMEALHGQLTYRPAPSGGCIFLLTLPSMHAGASASSSGAASTPDHATLGQP